MLTALVCDTEILSMPGCTILYCIALYCTVWYCVLLYCIALYCIVGIVLSSIELYCIALYCIVSYRIVLYCIVSYPMLLLGERIPAITNKHKKIGFIYEQERSWVFIGVHSVSL